MCKSKDGGDWWVDILFTGDEVTVEMSTICMLLP